MGWGAGMLMFLVLSYILDAPGRLLTILAHMVNASGRMLTFLAALH